MFQLGAGEAGLDLAVAAGAGCGQPLLPAPSAGPVAPHEELAAAQQVGGGLDEPVPVGVQRGDPAAAAVRHLVEVVGGVRAVQGVAAVDAVVRRDGDLAQAALVAELPGLVGGGEDPDLLPDRGVGPPVRGHRPLVRVADADTGVEEVGAVGQPQVDLEGQVAQAFPLPQAQHLSPVRGGDAGGVQGRAGEGGVAGGADVPFDAAGVPGAVEGEAGGLEHRVAVEEFASGGQVEQGGDAAAEAGQDGGAQPVVLDHEGVEGAGFAGSVVAVPDADREQAAQRLVAEPAGHVPGHAVPVAVVGAVHLVEGAQRGQGVVRAQPRGGQRQYLTSDPRHDGHATRRRGTRPGDLLVRITQRRPRRSAGGPHLGGERPAFVVAPGTVDVDHVR